MFFICIFMKEEIFLNHVTIQEKSCNLMSSLMSKYLNKIFVIKWILHIFRNKALQRLMFSTISMNNNSMKEQIKECKSIKINVAVVLV